MVFGLSLSAQQPTITLPQLEVVNSQEFLVDVKVSNFDSLIGMQYTIKWNPTNLQFLEILNPGLTGMSDDTFGTGPTNTPNGLLPVVWFDNSLQGVSVADETVIFTIKMKAIGGSMGEIIPLIFVDSPALAEIVNVAQDPIPFTVEEGTVTYMDDLVSSTDLGKKENLKLHHNYPNPFREFTYIQFELEETTPITLTINDLTGKEIYRKQEKRNGGFHQMKIDASLFPAAGEYIYSVQTTDNQLIGKLIIVK